VSGTDMNALLRAAAATGRRRTLEPATTGVGDGRPAPAGGGADAGAATVREPGPVGALEGDGMNALMRRARRALQGQD